MRAIELITTLSGASSVGHITELLSELALGPLEAVKSRGLESCPSRFTLVTFDSVLF